MVGSDGKTRESFAGRAVNRLRAAFPRPKTSVREQDGDWETANDTAHTLTAADLAEAVSQPVIVFDESGMVVLANAAARETFHTGRGVSLHLRFRAPEMHGLIRDALDAPAERHVIDYSERVPLERVFRVTASRLASGEGLFVLTFEDRSEARRIDRMRADFIANASHELRTPLASIAGFIETLRGPAQNDAKARERFLQIMQAQTERMARLIDDLLSLSRLEIKPYLKPLTRVDIVALVDGVVDAMAYTASEASVTIERDLPDTALDVAGNRDELVQVFENLLENACRYGASGGRVVVTVAPSQSGPTVSVRDFGQGIAEEHIPRITERFYRVDVETSRARKGTGLGLSIVKHILTRHEAWLTVQSKPGEGSLFTVHFPPA